MYEISGGGHSYTLLDCFRIHSYINQGKSLIMNAHPYACSTSNFNTLSMEIEMVGLLEAYFLSSLSLQTWVSYSSVILCTYDFQMFRVDRDDYRSNLESKNMIVEIRTWHSGAPDQAIDAGFVCSTTIIVQFDDSG